ncbi:MAG: hypothetical protein ACRDRW_05380 [Pseudonocardiaceae bacterium]
MTWAEMIEQVRRIVGAVGVNIEDSKARGGLLFVAAEQAGRTDSR